VDVVVVVLRLLVPVLRLLLVGVFSLPEFLSFVSDAAVVSCFSFRESDFECLLSSVGFPFRSLVSSDFLFNSWSSFLWGDRELFLQRPTGDRLRNPLGLGDLDLRRGDLDLFRRGGDLERGRLDRAGGEYRRLSRS